MGTVKRHGNETILCYQKTWKPIGTEIATGFSRARRGRFLGLKLLVCAYTPNMLSVNAIMAIAVAKINSKGQKL